MHPSEEIPVSYSETSKLGVIRSVKTRLGLWLTFSLPWIQNAAFSFKKLGQIRNN